MPSSKRLKICIDARLPDGPASGTRAVVVGLAEAMSGMTDGDEEYLFLVLKDSHQWLLPHVAGRCSVLVDSSRPTSGFRSLLKKVPGALRLWNLAQIKIKAKTLQTPTSDGTIEAAGVDVMHFLQSAGFLTAVPSIYQIHDLQHRHLPQFFPEEVNRERDFRYGAMAAQAKLVATMSAFGRQDAIDQFHLPPEKVIVVPWAAVFSGTPEATDADLLETRETFNLPDRYIFFPGHTWQHKNHVKLLEALVELRDKAGITVPLICSGRTADYYPEIRKRIAEGKLEDQVRFLGYVSPIELRCLYRLANSLVFPSLFEGWGLPLLEAAAEGTPIACSDLSPIRDVVGKAALLFDPMNASDIAEKIRILWTDEQKRDELAILGRQRAGEFSWANTARILRAHYRAVGGQPLSAEDEQIRSAAPIA